VIVVDSYGWIEFFTDDRDFEGLAGVIYLPKPPAG
jgi:hypothetical protein